jgi:hypothetical protein
MPRGEIRKAAKGWIVALELHQLRLAQHRQFRQRGAVRHLGDIVPVEPFCQARHARHRVGQKSGQAGKQICFARFGIACFQRVVVIGHLSSRECVVHYRSRRTHLARLTSEINAAAT